MKKIPLRSKINLFLRSLLFSFLMIFSAVVWSFVCVTSFLLPLRARCLVVALWTKWIISLLRVVCRIEYRVEGLENIPKHGKGIIMAKHQSTWETFFLTSFFKAPAVILKRELLWIPFFGWGLKAINPIAINRNNKTSAMEQITKQGRKQLANGRWILVFPEGTRVSTGHTGRYHLGGARLAVNTEHFILPIAHNAGRFWPRRKFLKMPGTVQVVIGPVIPTQGKTSERVLAETKDWIEKTMVEIGG